MCNKRVLIGAAVIAALAVWLVTTRRSPNAIPASPESAAVSKPAETATAVPSPVPPAPSSSATPSDPANEAPEPENPEALAATARMYAAHAPLRVPEVADPDAAQNREILNTMVTKALTRAAAATAPAAGAASAP